VSDGGDQLMTGPCCPTEPDDAAIWIGAFNLEVFEGAYNLEVLEDSRPGCPVVAGAWDDQRKTTPKMTEIRTRATASVALRSGACRGDSVTIWIRFGYLRRRRTSILTIEGLLPMSIPVFVNNTFCPAIPRMGDGRFRSPCKTMAELGR
jgi:hypothetical protein